MRTCREWRARIQAAVDGRLSIEDQLALEAHAAACDGCRGTFERSRSLEEALARVSQPPVERLDLERNVRSIRARIASAPRVRRAPRIPWIAIASGALAAGILVAILVRLESADSPVSSSVVSSTSPDAPGSRSDAPGSRSDAPGSRSDASGTSPDASGDLSNRSVDASTHEPAPMDAPPSDTPPAEVADSDSPPSDIHPLDANAIEESPLDLGRLAEKRDEMRGLLVESMSVFQGSDAASADTVSVAAFADSLDLRARHLARRGWPVARLVESLTNDADANVAGAALRYSGARGGRLALPALRAALSRADLRQSAAFALVDLGEAASDCLAAVLSDRDLCAPILDRLVARGGGETTRFLESAVRQAASRGDRNLAAQCTRALTHLGASAVAPLVRLGSSASIPMDDMLFGLEALGETDGASEALADLALARAHEFDDAILLQALARFRPERALAWIEEACFERATRDEALTTLCSYRSVPALATLLRVSATGRIDAADMEPRLLLVLERSGPALRMLAESWIQSGRKYEIAKLHELLLEHPIPACAPALIALAGAEECLPSSDRRWAALLAGELGAREDADALVALLLRLRERDKDLRAACILAIHSLAGRERVAGVLESASPRSARRILALLDERSARGKPVATLFKIARELEALLTPPQS